MNLPTPPDAWWVNVPWWAGIGFVLSAMLIMLVIAPFVVARAKGRPSAMLSREQAVVAQEAVIRQQHAAFVADMQGERDRILGRLRTTELDRERGWDIARGAELLLHQLYHDLCNMIAQRNSAWLLLGRAADGKLKLEVAAELVREHPPVGSPSELPPLHAIAPKRADETPYA